MKPPAFTLDDIKYAEGPMTFGRAQELYRSGKVREITPMARGYSAIVHGTHPYHVSVSQRRVDEFFGQQTIVPQGGVVWVFALED